jgi:hypothetical protein
VQEHSFEFGEHLRANGDPHENHVSTVSSQLATSDSKTIRRLWTFGLGPPEPNAPKPRAESLKPKA